MRAYSASGNRTLSTSLAFWELKQPATALKRLAVYYIACHSDATADNAYAHAVRRITAGGTATAFTPNALDPADGAASATFAHTHTVDPTITASSDLLDIGGHQRVPYQWYAPPDGKLIVAVTNNAGLVLKTITGGFAQRSVCHWEE